MGGVSWESASGFPLQRDASLQRLFGKVSRQQVQGVSVATQPDNANGATVV